MLKMSHILQTGISLAQKMSNMTYSIIARSCNKLMIGKSFWNCVALPSILYGSSMICWTKTEISKLQRQENKLGWRQRFEGVETVCVMCGAPEETLCHFLIECTALREVRERHCMGNTAVEGILLFSGNKRAGDVKRFLNDMWSVREKKLRG